MRSPFSVCLVSVMAITMIGCGQPAAAPAKGGSAATKVDHSEWWCVEHGVPESECGQCSAKVAAEFQQKGDWCKSHSRPESQCFLCNRDLEKKFAARYEAKYGRKPPAPTQQ